MDKRTIRHYEIQDELGRGGMGVVYRARDTRLKRDVAIKFLPRHIASSDTERKRFEVEAQAAASLNHPHIATIHAIEDIDGDVCIVMEYVDGDELKDVIERGPMAFDEVVRVATQIGEGLRAAHEKGVVHRDVKSRNIMLTRDGHVKIMDFGLAKVSGATQVTQVGSTVGTVAYMSPEQARGEDVDARTDVWSFGVVLYEMLAGRVPFRGDFDQAVIYAIVHEPHERVSLGRADVPEELESIVDRAMAKDRDARYASVAQMLDDLRALRPDAASSAARMSARSRPRAWRRRLGVGAAAVAAVAVFVAVSRVGLFQKNATQSIAVLPFVNERGDPDIEYLSDGLTESLIGHLSPIEGLRVMARTTVFRFKGPGVDPIAVGKELGVGAVLAGRVDQVGDKLVVGAELIDVASGAQMWGGRFNRTMTDIFSIEDEIASNIADKLRLHLAGEERERMSQRPTEDARAYQLYLKGRYHWNKRSTEAMPTALDYFEQAVAADPEYARAWVGIADCFLVGSGVYLEVTGDEAMGRASSAVKKALALDETLAEAHASYSVIAMGENGWDWESGEREFKRAIELNPGYATAHQWYSEFLYQAGRHEEAIAEIERALEIDPLSLIVNSTCGWVHLAARDADRAIAQFQRTLDMEPDFMDALNGLAQAYLLAGRPEREIAQAFLACDRVLGWNYAWDGKSLQSLFRARLAYLHGLTENRAFVGFSLAECHAQLGETDPALDLLEALVERHDPIATYMSVFVTLDPLRTTPRYRDLASRIGLPVE